MPKEGFLFKEGHLRKNFKKRWFVLDEGHLKYFEAPDALEPIATLVITGAEITSCKVPRPVLRVPREHDASPTATASTSSPATPSARASTG